jgi:iron(III) transport system permease protein
MNRIRHVATNPYNIITFIAIVALGFLILVPLWEILRTTFVWTVRDFRLTDEAKPGTFTLFHWMRIFKSNISKTIFYIPLRNSLFIGIAVSAISITLGSVFAYIITRTDLPRKKLFSFLLLVPYILPSWYISMAWLVIFKNERSGGRPGFLQAVFSYNSPNWLAYGFIPVVITLSLHYFAYTFLLVSSALNSIGGDLEEMAEIKGASRLTILRRITLPLVLPSLLSSFILTFSKAIGTFGVPAFLGLRVRFYTLSTMLYSSIRSRQTVEGYILSIVLIILAMLTVFMNQKMIGSRKSFTTISGKATRKNLVSLGRWKPLVIACLVIFIVFAVLFPTGILILNTFTMQEGSYSLDNLTMHFWVGESNPAIAAGESGIFRNPQIIKGFFNTMKLVVTSSLAATIIGIMFGYLISRGRSRLSGKLIEQVSFLPYLIPSIAFGAIYLSMFSRQHLFIPSLYGTMTLMILICVVKYLPFSTRAGTSTMMQINVELEEAAYVKGAGFVARFTKILIPLSKRGFLSGFLLIFISAMKELDLIVLLSTPATSTLSSLTYTYQELGFYQFSSAVITVIMILTIAFYLLSEKLAHADLSQGIGG